MFINRFAQLWEDIVYISGKYGKVYISGILNTLVLSTTATIIGCIIGFICGLLDATPIRENDPTIKKVLLRIVKVIVRVYVEFFRGTPMILQAVFIFYGLPYFTMNRVQFTNIWTVSILVVSINTGAYMAESVRGGIFSVDIGQTEGAMAIGMTHFQTMMRVVLPQAARNIMPQIGNNFIVNIKDTSVMFIIGFSDFFSVHKMVSGAIFTYFPSATIEMVGYLTLTLLFSYVLRRIERKMDGSANYELVQADNHLAKAGDYNRTVHYGEHYRSNDPGQKGLR